MKKEPNQLFWAFLINLIVSVIAGDASEVLCAYSHREDIVKFFQPVNVDGGIDEVYNQVLLDNNTIERCPRTSKYCYSFWQEDANNTSTILAQGCWDSPNKMDCSSEMCIARRPTRAHNNTNFCCCLGNFCNRNISTDFIQEQGSQAFQTSAQHIPASQSKPVVIVVATVICGTAVLVTVIVLIFRTFGTCGAIKKKKASLADSIHLMEANQGSPPLSLDDMELHECVGHGRYGSVFKASLSGQLTVIVKKFPSHHRQYFLNECYIYNLPFMVHPCLLKYFGSCEERGESNKPEYWLVLSYCPLGNLQENLRRSTVDWSKFCRMAQTITAGLAHLHTEIIKGDRMKMCVAHRDMTSTNVLVAAPDGSCKLCDFGFSTCISGSKYYLCGEEQVAETNSLADVGTLRYMAPEVLEGAVNLRDCESSLKQVDVYALGLILWEIASRCTDLYQGLEVPAYKLPFEAEIGSHCTMEQLQVLVSKNKARPLFPDVWKDTNPAVRMLKETIEDCWDQDAEARLTTLCVEERLAELPTLWDRYKAGFSVTGVSPTTINTTVNAPINHISNSDSATSPAYGESTTETLLSPDIAQTPAKNSLIVPTVTGPRVTVPLQPYQGRNPCIERNLMVESSDDALGVSGNTLLLRRNCNNDSLRYDNQDFLLDSSIPFTESNALVPYEYISQPSRVIPYLQNAVHTMEVVPKQPNLPGNGHQIPPPPSYSSKANRPKKYNLFSDCSRGKKLERSLRKGIKTIMGKKKPSCNQSDCSQQLTNNLIPIETEACLLPDHQTRCQPVTIKPYDIIENLSYAQRPNKLPLNLNSETQPCSSVSNASSSSSEKIAKRVKTPYELKNRLSLHDDSIMVESSSTPGRDERTSHPKTSLSLPHGINSLAFCESL